MAADKTRRLANALGFLAGVLASLDALRDTKLFWPPAVLWDRLQHAQRLELGGGITLMVVSMIFAVVRRRSA
ncbi:MAG: hypothetical protein WCA16_13070 [Candidatus Sulfotelmatobacter sp.]